MQTFTLAEAKAQLSRLIAMVEAGEDVTITKRGQAASVRNHFSHEHTFDVTGGIRWRNWEASL